MAVVHHPASHPYIAHIQLIPSGWQCHPEGTGLPDPDALCAGDVVHLHFGFEHIDAHTLATWVGRLRRRRVALVYTAHDLDNPHLEDQSAHHAALDVVAGAASAIVALTPWAAAELQRRTGAAAVVIPHPHVVPLEEVARRAAQPWPAERGVYVHAATLRPNLDLELVARVAGEARCFGGLRVHVRASSLTSATPAVRSRVVRLAALDSVTVEVVARLSDRELWDRIDHSSVVLLPYRWGTHSGLAEAGRDLGIPVVAPAFGGFADQGAIPYHDVESCLRVLCEPPPRRTRPLALRHTQRRQIAHAHHCLYEAVSPGSTALLARSPSGAST